MVVPIQMFDDYTHNYEDNAQAVNYKMICLRSAQNLVEDYLRYKLDESDYTSYFKEAGGDRLQLPNGNPHDLQEVWMDDDQEDVNDFAIEDGCLIYADHHTSFGDWGETFIKVKYKAGWQEEDVPALIRETILRIATLMFMEAGENIGVTSKSMPDNSRTFIQYTNYNKYLHPIASYRVVKF